MPFPATRPAVSVAMSVYNGERFLKDAIESVLGQTFTDFEFLILDDGSSDQSSAIIRDYAARDARIIPIFRENRGLVASLNELFDRASAPLVARMDADDVCLPERFAAQVAFLEAFPDYGVVGSWTLDIDENGDPYPLPLHGRDHPPSHGAFLEAIANGWPLLCHPAAMMRRDVVRAVGGYHGAFRHCEDYDLWLRLASVTKLGNVPKRLIRYRHYEEQVSSRHITEQQIGAAIAKIAYEERRAGRPDPTQTLESLPGLEELDALFGKEGIARAVRWQVAPNLLYSRKAMQSEGFDLVCDYLREGGRTPGLWRTAARLARFAMPLKAAHLAALLLRP